MVTTSVAEGFGLAFLEPWLAGKPLLGRDLPEITEDFKENGVVLDALYSSLQIPLDWIPEADLESRIKAGLRDTYHAYARDISSEVLDAAYRDLTQHHEIDFGRLDESLQEMCLSKVTQDPSMARERLGDCLHDPFSLLWC